MKNILFSLLILIVFFNISFSQVDVRVDITAEWKIDGVPNYYKLYTYSTNDTSISPFSVSSYPDEKYLIDTFNGQDAVLSTSNDTVYCNWIFNVSSDGKWIQAALVSHNNDSLKSETAVSNWFKTQDLRKYKVIKFLLK